MIARPPEILRADAFFPSFIAGLETVLSTRGHALLLQVAEHDDDAAYRRLVQEGRVDGVFVTDLQVDDARPALLEELGLPAVVIGPHLDEKPRARQSSLGVDDAPGIRAAVEHLVGLGHTRIAHVSGPQHMVHGRSRREAWSKALRDAGLPEGPCVEADFSAESGARAMRELLDLADRPTAVVFANDLMAMAGLSTGGLPRCRRTRRAVDHRLRRRRDLRPPAAVADLGAHRRRGLGTRRGDPTPRAHRRRPRPQPADLPDARLVVRSSTGHAPDPVRPL